MTLRTLNYGNYGIFLIMGGAGFCPSAVVTRPRAYQICRRALRAHGLCFAKTSACMESPVFGLPYNKEEQISSRLGTYRVQGIELKPYVRSNQALVA